MSAVFDQVRQWYEKYQLEPIDSFIRRVEGFSSFEQCNDFLRAHRAKVWGGDVNPITGPRKDLQILWYATHMADRTVNVEFWSEGHIWDRVWSLDSFIELSRTCESILAGQECPDELGIWDEHDADVFVTVSSLTSGTPVLMVSGLYNGESAVFYGVEHVVAFLVGAMMNVREAIVESHRNNL